MEDIKLSIDKLALKPGEIGLILIHEEDPFLISQITGELLRGLELEKGSPEEEEEYAPIVIAPVDQLEFEVLDKETLLYWREIIDGLLKDMYYAGH